MGNFKSKPDKSQIDHKTQIYVENEIGKERSNSKTNIRNESEIIVNDPEDQEVLKAVKIAPNVIMNGCLLPSGFQVPGSTNNKNWYVKTSDTLILK